ncbi:hypothetical protein K3759_01145 [Sulfitobacter sp. W027]|uniref:hypothetical protein n=1 Tax=Sulfitobacter sp. W027 TaxID=2867025 RepID=UPI0021A2E5E7|nr:hypothetical protein [Sulfitobacter sp. W027]UWR33732.1 hypothetical protein K3759_01145 [Sulfitobacter sp. W027]
MSSTKHRLRELERGNQRFEVRLTSLTFDNGGDTAQEGSQTAAFRCDGSIFEIARTPGEDAEAFARRAEAEGIALARAEYPKAIILAPGAEDL